MIIVQANWNPTSLGCFFPARLPSTPRSEKSAAESAALGGEMERKWDPDAAATPAPQARCDSFRLWVASEE
jgi:hypothetical protein